MRDAIILAGGFGTRLAAYVPGVPKPLVPVNGRPFLDYQLDWLEREGIERVSITTHHMADQIDMFVSSCETRKFSLSVVREDKPLGTGGAVKNALMVVGIDAAALVINGDTAFSFCLASLVGAHKLGGSLITIAVSQVSNVAAYGAIEMEETAVVGFRQASGENLPGFVSAGAYIIEPSIFSAWPEIEFSLEKDLLPVLATDRVLSGFLLDNDGGFHDIGTPKSYDSFCRNNSTSS